MADWIRVSCASLCRIVHRDQYLLLLNANRRARGIYVLAAIGGALVVGDTAILDAFGAEREDPSSHDLRLSLPTNHLEDFRQWFYTRQGREDSPYRELSEELVDEAKILPVLDPLDVRWRLLWTIEEEQFTLRSGQTGLLTHYFLEVFDIVLSDTVCEQLRAAPQESGAFWVDRHTIETQDQLVLPIDGRDRAVRLNAQLLLQPPSGAHVLP